MNPEIDKTIKKIKDEKRIGFMGHVIAGFPDYESSLEAAIGICRSKTDLLEVQFPFSDPTADGPVIEGACYKAIENGFTVEKGFKLIKELKQNEETPVLIMTYANIIFNYGISRFIQKAKSQKVSGLIIPDIPAESDEDLNKLCNENDLANILIAAPGADAGRVRQLSQKGSGFLYTVARRGITGAKSVIDDQARQWFKLVRENSSLPLAIGFGIRSPEQIKALKDYCEIAIAGSFLVEEIDKAYKKKIDLRKRMKKATDELVGD